MMKRLAAPLFAAAALAVLPAAAQDAPEIHYTAADIIQMPPDTYFGEVAGVATDSKGHVFVFQRSGNPYATMGGSRVFAHGGTQLLEFDSNGRFVREIGKGIYGFLVAEQVRVDPQDNIWAVDRYSGMVIKFAPDGSIAMLLGRKPESIDVPPRPPRQMPGTRPGAGRPQDVFTGPTDVAWDRAGNIFVADGYGGDARVAKFTPDGVFVTSWGAKGSDNDSFDSPRALAVDARGNVYVADHGNRRIQVFDGSGKYERSITGIGDPAALCLSGGAHPYLYSSNSNPVDDIDTGGEIYKLELDGHVVGKFGRAGKRPGEFGTVNEIDCRQPGTLFVAEIGNYRVQRLTLQQ